MADGRTDGRTRCYASLRAQSPPPAAAAAGRGRHCTAISPRAAAAMQVRVVVRTCGKRAARSRRRRRRRRREQKELVACETAILDNTGLLSGGGPETPRCSSAPAEASCGASLQ